MPVMPTDAHYQTFSTDSPAGQPEDNALITAMLEEARKRGYIILEKDIDSNVQEVLAIAIVVARHVHRDAFFEPVFKAAIQTRFGTTIHF